MSEEAKLPGAESLTTEEMTFLMRLVAEAGVHGVSELRFKHVHIRFAPAKNDASAKTGRGLSWSSIPTGVR